MGLFDLKIDEPCPENLFLFRDFIEPFLFEESTDGSMDNLVDVFDPFFCQFQRDIDGLYKIIDIDLTDEKYLDLLFLNVGFEIKLDLSVARKRRLLKVIMNAFKFKGTATGIEGVIQQFVGVDAKVFPFTTGWVLDQGFLGEDTYLNPSPTDPAGFYTFDVQVFQALSVEERRVILDLIELMKPAHSHLNELIETGIDVFLQNGRIVLNRGSLYLFNHQNDDGGWDDYESDGNGATISSVQLVSEKGLGQYFSWTFTDLISVDGSTIEAGDFLVGGVVYDFAGTQPEPQDIMFLNRAALRGVVGADTKRTEAVTALTELSKAIALLNDPLAPPALIIATTQAERDAQTLEKRAAFLYLRMLAIYGTADGVYRYCKYIQDYNEVAQTTIARTMADTLQLRLGALSLATAFGQTTLKTNAIIVVALDLFNQGGEFEARIQEAEAVIDEKWDAGLKLYIDLFLGTGRMEEQAVLLTSLMNRNFFGRAKTLMDGIRLQQRVDGSFDDPLDPGTSKLSALGQIMEAFGRAMKQIQDEGL